MRCKYIMDRFLEWLIKLYKVLLDLVVMSDVIVGFLGEIEVEF